MNKREQNEKSHAVPQRGRRSLTGKVILLVGDNTAVLQGLIDPLAQKGADIALLCAEEAAVELRPLRESVEASGRRFLHVPGAERGESTPQQIIDSITADLGQLDMFIDVSAPQAAESPPAALDMAQIMPNWALMRAALEQIGAT